MLKKTVTIFLFIILISAPAMAGKGSRGGDLPHGKWWNDTEVAAKLNLSKKEVQTLNDMYVDHRRKSIKLRSKLEEEQFELNNLIDSKTLNDKAVLKQSQKLDKARSTLSTERFRFFLDVRKLLGYDRYQQLKSMFQSMRDNNKRSRFKNMNRRHKGNERLQPSDYKHKGSSQHFGYGSQQDSEPLEYRHQQASDISPFIDSGNISEENL